MWEIVCGRRIFIPFIFIERTWISLIWSCSSWLAHLSSALLSSISRMWFAFTVSILALKIAMFACKNSDSECCQDFPTVLVGATGQKGHGVVICTVQHNNIMSCRSGSWKWIVQFRSYICGDCNDLSQLWSNSHLYVSVWLDFTMHWKYYGDNMKFLYPILFDTPSHCSCQSLSGFSQT